MMSRRQFIATGAIAGLGVAELRKLKTLKEENRKLKQLMAVDGE